MNAHEHHQPAAEHVMPLAPERPDAQPATDGQLVAAFRAGLLHAADMAQIAAVTIEARDDAHHVRQRAAIAALQALAEALREQAGKPVPNPVLRDT